MQRYVNLDIFEPADIIWNCRYDLPFPGNKFELVFSEHFLKPIDFPGSVKKILSEMCWVLKRNGELLIGVPGSRKVIDAYCKKDRRFLNAFQHRVYNKRKPSTEIYGDIDFVNYLFRDQLDNLNYAAHYWAYDEASLTNLLRSVGFREVKKWKFEHKYCNSKRKFYALYIKAIK